MNAAVKHLTWKERQLLTPLTIGFIAGLLLANLIFFFVNTWENKQSSAGGVTSLYWIAVAIHSLACGILLFSPEREAGTDSLLEQFPVFSKTVGKVKFLTGLIHVVTFVSIAIGLMALTFFLGRGNTIMELFPKDTHPLLPVIMFGVMPVTVFVFSMLASTIFRSPLKATLAAAGFLGLGYLATLMISSQLDPGNNPAIPFLSTNLVMLAAVGAGSWLTAQRWLRKGGENRPTIQAKPKTGLVNQAGVRAAIPLEISAESAAIRRSLRWQSFRYFLVPTIVCTVICGLYMVVALSGQTTAQTGNLVFAGVMGSVFGLLTFCWDQAGNSFHFFREQGSYPRKIWQSRLTFVLIGGIVVFLSSLVPFVSSWLQAQMQLQNYNWIQRPPELIAASNATVFAVLSIYLVAAAVGQFLSMLIRSPIILVGAGFLICPLMIYWVVSLATIDATNWYVKSNAFNLGLLTCFGLPIGLALFAATWYLAPRWISGRKLISSKLIATTFVLLICCSSVFGVAYFRIAEFERSALLNTLVEQKSIFREIENKKNQSPQFEAARLLLSAKANATPANWDSIANQDKQRKLAAYVSFWPDEVLQQFVADNKESFQTIKQALSKENKVYPFNPALDNPGNLLLEILAANAELAIRSNEVERSLDALMLEILAIRHIGDNFVPDLANRLSRWCELDGQTESTLRLGIEKLSRTTTTLARLQDYHLKLRLGNFLESVKEWQSTGSSGQLHWNRAINLLFPWEVERGLRFVGMQYVNANLVFERINVLLSDSTNYWRDGWFSITRFYQSNYDFGFSRRYRISAGSSLFDESLIIKHHCQNRLREIQLLRYAKVRWGLALYATTNKGYPRQLSDLAPDFLPTVPVDVFSGSNFYYSPDGLERYVVFDWREHSTNNGGYGFSRSFYSANFERGETNYSIEPNQPFLLPTSGFNSQELSYAPPPSEALDREEILGGAVQDAILIENPLIGQFRWGVDPKLKRIENNK